MQLAGRLAGGEVGRRDASRAEWRRMTGGEKGLPAPPQRGSESVGKVEVLMRPGSGMRGHLIANRDPPNEA